MKRIITILLLITSFGVTAQTYKTVTMALDTPTNLSILRAGTQSYNLTTRLGLKVNVADSTSVYRTFLNSLSKAQTQTALNLKQNVLSGTGIVKSTGGTISYLTDPLPIANGGTGSSAQNFVDLTTAQTVGGAKTLTGNLIAGGTVDVTGIVIARGNLTSVFNGEALTLKGNAVGTNIFQTWFNSGNVRRGQFGYLMTSNPDITLNNEENGSVIIKTNGVIRYTINASGNNTWDGTGTFGGSTSNAEVGLSALNGSTPRYSLGNSAGTKHWLLFETLGAAGEIGDFNIYNNSTATSSFVINKTTNAATFSGTATAATPTLSTHLTTKAYVDGLTTSGIYTPTLTAINNITASSATANSSRYIRVGDQVFVSGFINITTTSQASTVSTIGISLPIASNLTNFIDLSGHGQSGSLDTSILIGGDATNDRAELVFNSGGTSVSHSFYYSFSYTVK